MGLVLLEKYVLQSNSKTSWSRCRHQASPPEHSLLPSLWLQQERLCHPPYTPRVLRCLPCSYPPYPPGSRRRSSCQWQFSCRFPSTTVYMWRGQWWEHGRRGVFLSSSPIGAFSPTRSPSSWSPLGSDWKRLVDRSGSWYRCTQAKGFPSGEGQCRCCWYCGRIWDSYRFRIWLKENRVLELLFGSLDTVWRCYNLIDVASNWIEVAV